MIFETSMYKQSADIKIHTIYVSLRCKLVQTGIIEPNIHTKEDVVGGTHPKGARMSQPSQVVDSWSISKLPKSKPFPSPHFCHRFVRF